MLPVSLECPFFIAPSVFSNVYLIIFTKFAKIGSPIEIDSKYYIMNVNEQESREFVVYKLL